MAGTFPPVDGDLEVPVWVERALPPMSEAGLPQEEAAGMLEAASPDWHHGLAQVWTAYAGTLPPSPSVSSVNTGAQSVTYSPAAPAGEYGAALARAAWHRAQSGPLGSIPLRNPSAASHQQGLFVGPLLGDRFIPGMQVGEPADDPGTWQAS